MATFTFTSGTNNFGGTTLNDIYVLADPTFFGITDTANGGGGTDRLNIGVNLGTVSGTVDLGTRLTFVESITLLGTGDLSVDADQLTRAITFTGNSGINSISGGLAADKITGGGGADILLGGGGNDTFFISSVADFATGEVINGGAAGTGLGLNDAIIYTGTTAASLVLTTDVDNVEKLTIGSVTGSTAGLIAINVDASAVETGMNLTGNNGANILIGTDFDDILIGNDGADTLTGGDGNDGFGLAAVAHFDAGETMNGGAGTDTLFWTGGTALSLTNTFLTDANFANFEKITIGTIANVTTGAAAINIDASAFSSGKTITGNSGINRITGTGFDDVITGGNGNDNLIGGAGNDTYNYSATTQFALGETVNDASGTNDVINVTATTGTLTLTTRVDGIEVINLSGSVGVNAAALEAAVAINGGTGANIIVGTAFSDNIDGDAGGDTIIVSNSAHHGGTETLDGGTGTDTVRFASVTAGQTLTLNTNTAGIEAIVIGTGTTATAVSTATTALNVDASNLTNGVSMTGNAGANTLTGTDFDDTITGGLGSDTLQGGDGNDLFLFGNSNFTALEVVNGGSGTDVFRFTGGSSTAATTVTLTDNVSNVEIFEIATGTGATGVFTGTLSINMNASAITDNGVSMTGNSGINTLTGTAFDDVLDGNGGRDTLNGGAGNDTFKLTNNLHFAAGEIMDGSTGNDTLNYTGAAATLTLTTGIRNIEFMTVTSGSAAINVNAAAVTTNGMTITGNDGNNTITGTALNDTLSGGDGIADGSDTLNGGAGIDTVDYSGATGNITMDLSSGAAQNTGGAGTDTVTNIENITGGSGNDTLSGTTGDNVIIGGNGNDTLSGGSGNDTLTGGTGNDILTGGTGTDSLSGGDDVDTLNGDNSDSLLDGGNGTDTLNFGANFDDTSDSQVVNIENVVLTAAASLNLASQTEAFTITGSTGNDSITSGGGADTISGGNGNDTITGGSGADSLSGGAGNDTLNGDSTDTLLDGGTETDTLNINSFTDGGTDDAKITGIENIILTGAGTLALSAQTEAFTITGSSGDDIIYGGTAGDSITGGSGNDNIQAGMGDDSIFGGSGDTFLDGGADNDTLFFGGSFDDDTDGQITNVENVTLTAAATLNLGAQTEVFTITGSSGADTITGGTAADSISGGGGNDAITADASDTLIAGDADTDTLVVSANFNDSSDGQITGIELVTLTTETTLTLDAQTEGFTITGSGSDDVITSGSGADTIIGGNGADTINGGMGIDTLSGNSGADSLSGGAGNDSLFGDADDTLLDGGSEIDTLNFSASFDDGSDGQIVNIENIVLTAAATLDLSFQTESFTIIGSSSGDVITGGSGNDIISSGDGFDDLHGGQGNDTLTGGTSGGGGDFFYFETTLGTSNVDTITDFDGSDNDQILLDFNVFDALTGNGDLTVAQFQSGAGLTAGTTADARIIYNTTNGNLYYDADGNASTGDEVLFANLSNLASLDNTSFTVFNFIA